MLGLRQPAGVGARPRPMATELCNQNDTAADLSAPSSLSTQLPSISVDFNNEDDRIRFTSSAAIPTSQELSLTFKPLSRHLSLFGSHQQKSISTNLFSGGASGDGIYTDKHRTPYDSTNVTVHRSQPEVRGDDMVDNLAQVNQRNASLDDFRSTSIDLHLFDPCFICIKRTSTYYIVDYPILPFWLFSSSYLLRTYQWQATRTRTLDSKRTKRTGKCATSKTIWANTAVVFL